MGHGVALLVEDVHRLVGPTVQEDHLLDGQRAAARGLQDVEERLPRSLFKTERAASRTYVS